MLQMKLILSFPKIWKEIGEIQHKDTVKLNVVLFPNAHVLSVNLKLYLYTMSSHVSIRVFLTTFD